MEVMIHTGIPGPLVGTGFVLLWWLLSLTIAEQGLPSFHLDLSHPYLGQGAAQQTHREYSAHSSCSCWAKYLRREFPAGPAPGTGVTMALVTCGNGNSHVALLLGLGAPSPPPALKTKGQSMRGVVSSSEVAAAKSIWECPGIATSSERLQQGLECADVQLGASVLKMMASRALESGRVNWAARAGGSPVLQVGGVNKLLVITLWWGIALHIFAFNSAPTLEVLEQYFEIGFVLEVRGLRSTWFWISTSLRHHGTLRFLTAFFSCVFNFRHEFCLWVIVKNSPTRRNLCGQLLQKWKNKFQGSTASPNSPFVTDITAK